MLTVLALTSALLGSATSDYAADIKLICESRHHADATINKELKTEEAKTLWNAPANSARAGVLRTEAERVGLKDCPTVADWSNPGGAHEAKSAAETASEASPTAAAEPAREPKPTKGGKKAATAKPAAPMEEAVDPSALDSLDDASITRTLDAKGSAIRACFEKGLAKSSRLKGDVKVRFQVLPSGKVKEVSVDKAKTTLHDDSVVRCISGQVKAAVFPRFRGSPVDSSRSWSFSAK